MKRVLIFGGVVSFIIASYFSFEPAFRWVIGWKALPDMQKAAPHVAAIEDDKFLPQITNSQKLLSKSHLHSQAPAFSIAVGIANELVWAEARGFSDIAQGTLANTQTTFRIGSVSKAVTSVALGKLLEQGKLSLDDSVGHFMPRFAHPDITIRQLASHTSGIRNYRLCLCLPVWEYYSNDSYTSVEESIEVFNGDPLLFEPGASFSYSTYNYTLLSGVMEKASKVEFLNLMTQEVFQLAHMKRTSGDYADSLKENQARYYEIRDNKYREVYPVNNSNKWAGGGLVSTPTDLVLLANALLNQTIINKETVETLFTEQRLENGTINPQHYALGWRNGVVELYQEKRQVRILHHGGTALGATALLILFPEYQLSIAMVMNKHSESFTMFDYVIPIAEEFIRASESINEGGAALGTDAVAHL